MTDGYTAARNALLGIAYRAVLKPLFFCMPPETIHARMVRAGEALGKSKVARTILGAAFSYAHPSLEQTVCGIRFSNPIGLSAGFDKDAHLTRVLGCVGFGFAEVGSVTAQPYGGNAGIRAWRLPKSRGLVINYGLKNDGANTIFKRLASETFKIPVGVSVALTNDGSIADIDEAIQDYALTTSRFSGSRTAYVTINISCPNASIGQPFVDPVQLDRLLTAVKRVAGDKPVFLKLSPDLSFDGIDALVDVGQRHGMSGYICTNLVKNRTYAKLSGETPPDIGGISGKPMEERANAVIEHVYRTTRGKTTIIGCGGVFSAQDAYSKICLGASLIQMITGMIYEGPQVISEINHGLVRLLKQDRLHSITEAVGSAV